MRSSVLRGLLLLGAGLLPPLSLPAAVVERILAVVDGRPVLLSEVRVVERVRDLDEKKALDAAIDERLMFVEAARVPQARVSPEEERAAYDSLLERAGSRVAGLPEADLRDLARREATVLKYIQFRFLPQVRVDDEAVRKAYEAETAGQTAPPALEEAAPALRQRLVDSDLDARIEAWVKELRDGADIRYNDAS